MTRDDIERRTGARSFSRGRSYFKAGAVFDTIREEDGRLRARCMGSRAEPYDQYIVLTKTGDVATASCSCALPTWSSQRR